MKSRNAEPPPKIFVLVGMLIIAGFVADLVGVVAYQLRLSESGIGWFELVPWSHTWEFLTSPLGAVLTFLGVAPWIVLLGFLYFRKV